MDGVVESVGWLALGFMAVMATAGAYQFVYDLYHLWTWPGL